MSELLDLRYETGDMRSEPLGEDEGDKEKDEIEKESQEARNKIVNESFFGFDLD